MRTMFVVPTTKGCDVMVLVACNSGWRVKKMHAEYPGSIGWMLGPTHWKKPIMEYALDNDAFSAWTHNMPWNESAWLGMLDKAKACGHDPMWALVPDVVADAEATLEKWERYAPVVSRYGWQKAFAVQDGMTASDVPHDADIVFVGGTTRWKLSSLEMWASSFPRVHVGRVNTIGRLLTCDRLGIESVDGTGWTRDTQNGSRIECLEALFGGTFHRNLEFNFNVAQWPKDLRVREWPNV